MTWPFEEDNSALPVRDGFDVGGGQERTMAWGIGGYGEIRHAEERNFDGSITTLDTRAGRPIFETASKRVGASSIPTVDYARGFVAWAGSRAVRFNPYTLTVLDANYLLAGKRYTVQDFETTWNVSDTTDWFDVALIDGTNVRINGKWMQDLVTTISNSTPAIPYIINRGLTLDQYGDATRNATEKRVFPVGRYHVESFGGGGVTEILTPTDARANNKAMTIGQRVDWSLDKAWLGQLYFVGHSWNDLYSSWAFSQREVDMTLSAPYLAGVNSGATVDLAVATLGAAVPTSGSVNDPVTLPETPIALRADSPTLGQNGSFPTYLNPLYWVKWLWNGTENRELAGAEVGSFTGEDRSGSGSDVITQAGRTLTYTALNEKSWKTKSLTTEVNEQTFDFGASGPIYTDVLLGWNGVSLGWSVPAPTTANRGGTTRVVSQSTISGSSAVKSAEEQAGSFRVETPAVVLVDLAFSQNKTSGQTATITPNTTYYDSQMGAQNYPQQFVGFRPYGIPTTPPPSHASVNAEFAAMQAAWAVQTVREVPSYAVFYSSSVGTLPPTVTAALTWSTRDYLLYDDINGVYITLIGVYSGSQTAAGNATSTLTVTLEIKTRFHTIGKTLATFNYSPGTLLIEHDLGGGKWAVPSPQIRAIFAPLYQEQGSFKGSHYVELSEGGNGADSAHLFNFLLYLKTYSGLGSVNSDNNGPNVVFVPCNFLEMCHAYIFSDEYGIYSGARYPINYTTRYNDMITALFTTPFRISVRDGVETQWSDSFGADFAAVPTVSLYRT